MLFGERIAVLRVTQKHKFTEGVVGGGGQRGMCDYETWWYIKQPLSFK